ncbi:MAG: CRISPR system precrRNA processing endoribonuclease RAMP protein Cas6 [Candidatus Nezhaarchaeales archaeon]
MISVVEFVFRALSGGGLPWFVGHECRAGLIDLVSRLDPELGSVFHEGFSVGSKKKAVFSLKPLRFVSDFEVVFPEKSHKRFLVDGNVVFRPGARALMHVSIFGEELAGKFLTKLLSGVHEIKLNIKGYEFVLEKLGFELVNLREVMSADPVDEVDIEFITPTYFNPIRGDAEYKILYPDPTLLFASLISTSHQLTGTSYPKPEEIADQTYISGLDIKTPLMKETPHETPTGFVGWTKLRIKKGTDENTKRVIAGLLRLGEITNVGGNRSGGYGVIKLKFREHGEPAQSNTREPSVSQETK